MTPATMVVLAIAVTATAARPAEPLDSAGATTSGETYRGRQRQLDVRVPRIAGGVRVDGRLDENVWSG